jgi:predicted amidohydrolase
MVYFVPRAVQARAYILINNSAGDTQETLSFGYGAMILDPLGQVVKRTRQPTRADKTLVVTITKPLDELVPDFETER